MFKRIIPVLTLSLALLASCSKGTPTNETTDPEAVAAASREELEQALTDRDQLLQLTTEIQQNLDQIKEMENIISVTSNETPDRRQQIKNDIDAIKQALIEKQQRLDELERKLSSSNLYSANLQKTIETLRAQIENQTAEIERLTTELTNANQRITQLGTQVDSLNTTVQNVTTERDAAEQQAIETANELNTCYYAVGSSKELKAHNILEGGFLRKTKVMEGEIDRNYFTKADKRTLTTIKLYSKKAQVMTSQPKQSYTISDVDGQKVLTITNPQLFWEKSNFLVVKID